MFPSMVRSATLWLWFFVGLLSAVFLTSTSAQRPSNLNKSELELDRRVKKGTLGPAIKMLKKQKVPFDTALLLDEEWRTKLAPAFAKMPEMQTDIHSKGVMKGVYLARAVLIPREVELLGDTVIIAKELAPDDEDSEVIIRGEFRLVSFIIGDAQVYDAIRRKRRATQFLNIDVAAPCALIGLSPIYYGHRSCRGMTMTRP